MGFGTIEINLVYSSHLCVAYKSLFSKPDKRLFTILIKKKVEEDKIQGALFWVKEV